MRSRIAGLRILVLPYGAGINDPAIISGPADGLPDSLIQFYIAEGTPVVGGTVYRNTGTSYEYDVLITDGVSIWRAVGNADPNVAELYRIENVDLVPRIVFGGVNSTPAGITLFGTQIISGLLGGELRLQDGTALTINPGVGYTIDGIAAPRGMRDGNVTNNGTVATSVAGAEAAVPSASWDIEPTFTFIDGHLYLCHAIGSTINAAATAQLAQVRVRKGSASVAGTQLAMTEIAGAAGFAGLGIGFVHRFYIKNVSGSDVNTALSLTIQRAAGAANYSLFGDANRPLRIDIEDVGLAAEQPGLAADAGSV